MPVVLVGLFGAAVLAAVAGARRTDSAYPRFLRASQASEVFVSPFVRLLRNSYEEIRQLPQVADAGIAAVPLLVPTSAPPGPEFLVFPMISVDGRYGYTIDRPNMLEGRMPRHDRPSEALVDPTTARKFGLSVGSQFTMQAFERPPGQPNQTRPTAADPTTFTVVGIGVFPDQVVPTQLLEEAARLFLPPAAYPVHGASPDSIVFEEIFVRLKAGADLSAFLSEVERITAADADAGGFDFSVAADRTPKVERAIRPQSTALWLFAILAAVAAVLIIGQVLARQIRLEAAEYPTLAALGMTRRELASMAAIRTGGIALAGGGVAAVLAIASSPLLPIGPARLAEPNAGVSADAIVLCGGLGVMLLLLLAVTAWPTWQVASTHARGASRTGSIAPRRPSRVVSVLARAGAPASVLAGVRLAVEPARGSAAATRRTLSATTVALLALIAAVTFGANLDRLISDPERYGLRWHAALDGGYSMLPTRAVVARLSADPAVAGFSGGTPGELVIDGRAVPAVGLDLLRGSVFPTLLEGRPPETSGEIVLGTKVLRRLGLALGDSVEVGVAGTSREMRIVGRAVFPAIGVPGHEHTGLGEGAAVTGGVLPPISPPDPDPENVYNFFLVRFRADAVSEGRQRLEADTYRADGPFGHACDTNAGACVLPGQRPGDISNYARVRATPVALAAALVLLGIATMGHALIGSSPGRRRELAILRTLGFLRRQVWATLACQATTLAGLTVLIGLPVGVLAGRWAWILFAEQLGVAPSALTPVVAVLATALATLVVANVMALGPARNASRTSPANILRSE